MVWRCVVAAAAVAVALLNNGVGAADAEGLGPPDFGHEDSTIAELIQQMHLCFLEPGAPGTPAKIDVPLVGTLKIWRLCCENSSVGGLDVRSDLAAVGEGWRGATKLTFELARLETQCQAHWTLGLDAGDLRMHISTLPAGPADDVPEPFVRLAIGLAGDPVAVGGDLYPFPGKTTDVECKSSFVVSDLQFDGSASWLLKVLGKTATLIQGILRPMVCSMIKDKLPAALDTAIAAGRDLAAPLIESVPDDLPAPSIAPGAGPTLDLRQSKPISIIHRLFQQGVETGDLGRLVDQATGGTGAAFQKFPQEGLQLATAVFVHPTNLSISVFAEDGGLEGVHTIDELSLNAKDAAELSMVLAQKRLNVSVGIRTFTTLPEVSAAGTTDTTARRLQQIVNTLLERFRLRLALSDVRATAHSGLFINRDRLDYLDEGTTWYTGECIPGMVQNASLRSLGIQVTVEEFTWVSAVASPTQLEAEFDRSVNSLLRYLNAPPMRPTISRLVRSIAAGQVRDTVNQQVQTWLATPPDPPCEANFGTGSVISYTVLSVIGAVVCFLAVAAALRWTWCGHRCGGKRPGRRCAALLALGGFCFLSGGLIGYPFRAAFRMHSGATPGFPGEDTIQYLYVLDLRDPMGPMPGAVAVTMLATVFGTVRLISVIVAALCGLKAPLARLVRWTSAAGSWDMAVLYVFAGTQITSFYARMVQFGDTFLDMGVQINVGFYLAGLGLYLCDFATLAIYGRCSAKTTEAALRQKVPSRFALGGLVVALAVLLGAPWYTLWSHRYSGVVGKAIHFQSGKLSRSISIATILGDCQGWLLNPLEIGIGAYLIQLFIVVHVVVAPIVHALLALYVGVSLRLRRMPPAATCGLAAGGSASFLTAGPEQSQADVGFAPVRAGPKAPFRRLGYALVLARMWSGADAFAATMFVVVPELGGQLWMMSKQGCDPMMPALDKFGAECNVLESRLQPGLLALLLAGLAVRALAEICAHGPLRGMLRRTQSSDGGLGTQLRSAREVSPDCDAPVAATSQGGQP